MDTTATFTKDTVLSIPMTPTQRTWFFSLLLMVLTMIVYLPAMNGGFIWDDDAHLTTNPVIVGPLGLKEIWTTSAARICPLTLSCFWLQHALWGLHPLPYHLVNITLHSISAILLWRILLRLNVPGAWFGALLWSVHPVQVESVAWITELKNVQSCLLYLATILCSLKWINPEPGISRSQREGNYILAVVFAALAMASKSSTVILPVVVGLCAWWFNVKLNWSNALRLAPFFVLAALASGVTLWTVELEGSGDPRWLRTWPEKIVTVGNVVWFYIGKLLWPHPLNFIYPRWEVDAAKATSYLGIVAVCGAILFLWWNRSGRMRPVFFAFVYFLTALLPVLGLVEHFFLRYSFVGDHFQYLASIGIVPLISAYVAKVCQSLGRPGRSIGVTMGIVAASTLGALTWRYESVFADNEGLWRDTLSKNKSAWIAHNNLGNIVFKQGNYALAVSHYEEVVRLTPNNPEAYNNLGLALFAMGDHSEAIRNYTEALRLDPHFADAQLNWGNVLAAQKDYREAIGHYALAMRLKPDFTEANNNLGVALMNSSNYAEAILYFTEALRLNPNYADAHDNLGIVLEAQGQFEEATSQYREVVRLRPHHAEAHYNLGMTLGRLNRRSEAESQFLEALRLKPDYADAQTNLDRLRAQ